MTSDEVAELRRLLAAAEAQARAALTAAVADRFAAAALVVDQVPVEES